MVVKKHSLPCTWPDSPSSMVNNTICEEERGGEASERDVIVIVLTLCAWQAGANNLIAGGLIAHKKAKADGFK